MNDQCRGPGGHSMPGSAEVIARVVSCPTPRVPCEPCTSIRTSWPAPL